MIKLVFAAVIVVGSLLTLVAKRFWGQQALERKLAKKKQELKDAQDKRQALLEKWQKTSDSLSNLDEYYIADDRCSKLSEAIYNLRRRLKKDI